jgi:glycosyltransferase involved in cell wall biosynthesis
MQNIPVKLRLYTDILEPYFSVWILFFIAFCITYPICLYVKVKKIISKILNPNNQTPSLLCLEAGVRGWEIIEYKELYQSALEYMGDEGVVKFAVTDEGTYLEQLRIILDSNSITHYGWSPRTGEQHRFNGLIESLKISIMLSRRGIVPIVFLTDILDRSWRAKASIVTAVQGRVVTLNSPDGVKLLLPHKRFIGPYLMPFSLQTIEALKKKKQEILEKKSDSGAVVVGALYEPRKTIVENIDQILSSRSKHSLIFQGRTLEGKRSSDEDYWSNMFSAQIVVTTASVVNSLDGYDWAWKEHFIYRYMETLACETLLVAPELPAIKRYFTSGDHFISFSNEEDAAQKIQYYLENDEERQAIANKGFQRAQSLVESRSFWLGIDTALAEDGMTR